MARFGWSVLVVWGASLVAAVLVALLGGQAFLAWTAIALSALVLLTAAIQLAIQRKEGFVLRLAASVSGAAVILTVTSIVLLVLDPSAGSPSLWLD